MSWIEDRRKEREEAKNQKDKKSSGGTENNAPQQSGQNAGGSSWIEQRRKERETQKTAAARREQKAEERELQQRREAMLRSAQLVGQSARNRVADAVTDAAGTVLGIGKGSLTRAEERLQNQAGRYERDMKLYQDMAYSAGQIGSSALYAQALKEAQDRVNRYNQAAEDYTKISRKQAEDVKKNDPTSYYTYLASEDELNQRLEELQEARELVRGIQWTNGMGGSAEEKAASVAPRIEAMDTEIAALQAAKKERDRIKRQERYDEMRSYWPGEYQKWSPEQFALYEKGKAAYERDQEATKQQGFEDLQKDPEAAAAVFRDREKPLEYSERDLEDGHLKNWQKNVFYAIYATDPEVAREWLTLAQEQADNDYYNQLSRFYGQNPFTRGAGLFAAAGTGLASGLDPYGEWGQNVSKTSEAIRRGISQGATEHGLFNTGLLAGSTPEEWGAIFGNKSLGDLYELGVSMVESGALAAGSAAVGKYDTTLGSVVGFLGTALMGSEAAASDYRESVERGLTREQAIRHATAAGLAEAAFEYISLDKLVKQDVTAGFWKNFFVQGGVEASEELCTTLANRISDGFLAYKEGYDDTVRQRIKELRAMGLSPKEAEKKAGQEWVTELINDGLGGFFSGGIMTAGNTLLNWDEYQAQKALNNYNKAMKDESALNAADAVPKGVDWLDGSELEETAGQSRTQTHTETGRTDSSTPLRSAQNDNILRQDAVPAETERTDSSSLRADVGILRDSKEFGPYGDQNDTRAVYEQTKAETAKQARELDDETLRVMADNVERNLEESGPDAPASELAVMEGQRDALRQEISAREAVNRNGERIAAAVQRTDVPGPEWNDGSELETGKTDSSSLRADVGIGPYEENGGRQSAVPTNENGGQIARATETGERIATASGLAMTNKEDSSYGTGTEGAADGGQRDAGLGTRGQTGGLGAGTGGQVARGGGTSELRQLRDYVQARSDEQQSPRQLGIIDGTKNASLIHVDVEALEGSLGDRYRSMQEQAARDGVRLDLVIGQMEVRQNGRTVKSSGVMQIDADGTPHVFIQADSKSYSPEQLYDHEIFHAIISRNKGLWQDIVRHLYETRSREEIRAMVDAYVQAYDGCYGTEEADAEKYIEEIFADMYGEMRRGGGQQRTARNIAESTAQRFAGDIENARQNRAGIERRNGPGTRLSFAGKNAETANVSTLDEAQRRINEGEDSETVRQETGWYRGMDGKWRFEIDDSQMRVILPESNYNRLGDLVDHPALFEAYPDLAETDVFLERMEDGKQAKYNPQFDTISINKKIANDAEEFKTSLIHEIQHAIQEREGFTAGASRQYWEKAQKEGRDTRTIEERRAEQELRKEYEAWRERSPQFVRDMEDLDAMEPKVPRGEVLNWDTLESEPDPPEWVAYDQKRDELQDKYGDQDVWDFMNLQYKIREAERQGGKLMPSDLYQRTAGEIEARDTANRLELDAEQRKNTRPDIDREDVVFRADRGESLSSEQKDDAKDAIHKLIANIPKLEDMKPLADLTGNEFQKREGAGIVEQVMDEYSKFGSKVSREGFGEVLFTKSKVKGDAIGHGFGRAKAITYEAVPEIIKYGRQIDFQENWKNRGYDTFIFAGPVNMMEQKAYVCVVVQRDSANRFYLHEVVDSNGNYIMIDKDTGEIKTGSAISRSTSAPTSLSDNIIADNESGVKQRFSAADEEDVGGVDWLDGSELEETAGPSRTPAPTETGETEERIATGPEGPRNDNAGETDSSTALRSTQNDRTEAPAKTDVPSSVTAEAVTPSPQGEGFAALAREKKVELAERVGIDGLKSRIENEEKKLEAIRTAERMGLVAQDAKSRNELAARKADLQETIDIFRGELEKKQAAKKAAASDKALKAERKQQRAAEKKALAKEAELKDNKPRQARREFREDAMNLFSVQAGKRQTLGNIINSFADKLIAQGSVSEADRAELFRQLYEAGVEVVPADEYHRNIRETVDSARIYVPDSVREEFGDDWNDFRQRAWGNGVYLTNDAKDRGADSWNAELAEMFPGSFDAEETDARNMLENIVDLAEEGKAEFVSLPEMMRRNQDQTGVTVDQQMDELERKVDHLIDTFAQKADLEIRTRKQGTMQLVKERQRNREMAARQVQRQRENNTRNEVMKQLQQLNRMRKKSAPEIQRQIDDIIGNLDTMARSISPEGMENLQALARKYEEAKAAAGGDWASGGNFLGNPYVEARLARLGQIQLDSLEISDVIELGNTISALVKSVTEDKRLLTDAREREISEAAAEVAKEISSSAGSKGGKLREFLGNEHLSPTRELQRLGGWVRGGMMEQLSRSLEDGGTRRMEYQRQATRIFDDFLSDKANQEWLRKAQGKDAEWITITAKVGVTGKDVLSGEAGPKVFKDVTFELTPMMRVGLLMHSKNKDNLRHIDTGGIVIPNKECYLKGNLADADAKGLRVKIQPEIVRAIVKDCTAQEKAFAALLEQYYDGFSKEKINEVSMLIDGFERAGGDHYYHIPVSRAFLATLPEQVKQNLSLEAIQSIVNERIHAGNPIVLEDASTALKDHIDLISKYYGYTAPIRDFNAVMNYTFHFTAETKGGGEYVANAFSGSVKETLQAKWGAGAQKYIDDLLGDLQQSSGINETAAAFLAKLRGNLAGASLMFNPAVALSQTASLPGTMQTLGLDGVVASLKPEKVDMNLIAKYTPILWYRNQGNSTQELGDYMSRQGLEGKLPWMFNWIQKMDSWTIRRIWVGAEYRVSKDTDLAPGSKAQIDAGEDPYYQEVARVFQRAVYDTQPNYSEMQRPAILRTDKDIVKFLTMYKTVPLQYYNMMYEAVGRLKADKARFEADGSAANKAQFEQSRSFAVRTFAGVLGANVVYVVMKAAVKGLLGGKDDRFKDEEGKFDWGKTLSGLGKDLIETYAGSVICGSELLGFIEKQIEGGNYYNRGVFEISALSAVNQTIARFQDLRNKIVDQDLTGGLGAIKELAKQLAMDTGIPANNIETYLLGTAKWFAPEWVDRYENFFDEFERADLKGEHGRDLRAAISVLMDNRTDGLKDETIDELMRLWETGQNAVIPSAIPSKVSVEGEDVEIKGKDKATFRERWGQVIDGSLEKLLASDAYQAADDVGKAQLISKLYEYARQQAAAAVTDKKVDAWVEFGKACEAAGIPLDQYLSVVSVDKSKLKDMDGEALDNAIQARMEFRVGELDEKTLDELGRLYAAGGTGAIPADVPTSVSVSGEENNLTAEERVAWLQAWKRTAGESLEALMASKAYAKADDDGKAKLISALYDMARASASSEVVAGYEPDKWISVGMEAQERGVPLDEYAAFHVGMSGLKTTEKMDLLKSQNWTEDQKEILWSKLMASDSQLVKYENLKKTGLKWSDAMELLGIGEASTSSAGLTDSQQVQYDKYFSDISGPATQRLLNNTAYKRANKATQAAYLDRMNDYAARIAKGKVLSGYDKGKWVECGERLTGAGVRLDDYIIYYTGISDAKNRDKYDALAKTGWTSSQKLIAMEYISSSTYSAAKVCTNYQINIDLYLNGLAKADADQSGNISQAEAEDYLDGLSIGQEEKAYLWQLLSIQSKWKNNPYSAGYGEEIWHDLHPEG